jgi:hypothetical protein
MRFLGSFFCDRCSHGMREDVWLNEDGTRLCRAHAEELTGLPPPRPLTHDDLTHTVTPEPPWQKVVLGLRACPGEAGHSIALQGVRNIQLEQGARTVGDTPLWVLGEADLVDLFILASAYRNQPERIKNLARVQLFRLLHGKDTP